MKAPNPHVILVAEDDPDDRLLIFEALQENGLSDQVQFVHDGEELVQYLNREGRFAAGPAPYPHIILLDLNMPRMDGREALRILKSSPIHRKVPIVVLTTSSAPEEILKAYELGGNSFITKPSSFKDLVEVTQVINQYWFGVAATPSA